MLRSTAVNPGKIRGCKFPSTMLATTPQEQDSPVWKSQYRTKTAATSFNGVVQELRPTDSLMDIPDIINFHAGWMLEILLALRQEPAWIYQAIRAIGGRAMQLAEKARYDEWTATLANRSQLDSLGA